MCAFPSGIGMNRVGPCGEFKSTVGGGARTASGAVKELRAALDGSGSFRAGTHGQGDWGGFKCLPRAPCGYLPATGSAGVF